MMTNFHAPTPWPAIKAAAKGVKGYVAVPYLGKGAAAMLPLTPGSILITRFTREAVKAGQVDPGEVIKFIRRGVSVFNQSELHAKMYVFPRKAFVGSANASKTSERLIEACVEITDPAIVRKAREFVRSLDSDLITLEYAKSMVEHYPKNGERYFGEPQKTLQRRKADMNQFWISNVMVESFDEETERADRTGSIAAKAEMKKDSSTRLTKTHYVGSVEYKVDDWILNRMPAGRGFDFECPGRVIHIEHFQGKRRKEALVYLEHPKHQKKITSSEIRKKHSGLVAKLCFPTDADRRLRTSEDIATVKRLWKAFRA